MKTSTPIRLNPMKIIVIHEVSNLKIYEDFDDIAEMNNNNDADCDISELTVYENLRNFQDLLIYDDIKYVPSQPAIQEESGFKIYEDIGDFGL